MRTLRIRRISVMPPLVRAVVLVAVVSVVALTAAGCGGDRGDREAAIPDAQLLRPEPPPTLEAHVRARPWASSRARIQAWGSIWREQTRNPKDREGRGIDATNWAIRTCDAVRNGGQTPRVMVRRVRDVGRFTEQGAKVIVTAALSTLCPGRTLLSPLGGEPVTESTMTARAVVARLGDRDAAAAAHQVGPCRDRSRPLSVSERSLYRQLGFPAEVGHARPACSCTRWWCWSA
jgi:hypothetical protein